MKLTTKRNRWYFWKELFNYIIPMILIVGVIDVFVSFMRCPLHPEWSAPCSVNWFLGAIYGFFLILAIILAILSTNKLKKIKKQIEKEDFEKSRNDIEDIKKNFTNNENSENKEEIIIDKVKIEKKSKPKKIIVEGDTTLKNKHKTKENSNNI